MKNQNIWLYFLKKILKILYFFLKNFTSKLWAIFGTCLLVFPNFFLYHATISYRDLFLSYYTCSGILFLILWQKYRNDGFLIIASLMAGFASFTKLEGAPFLLIHTTLLIIILKNLNIISWREKIKKFIKFVIPSYSLCLYFQIYKIVNHIPMEKKETFDFNLEIFSRLKATVLAFIENLLFSGDWGMIWFLALSSVVIQWRNLRNTETKIIFLAILLFFMLYGGLALFTSSYFWIAGKGSDTTLNRLLLHFFPLSTILIVLLNHASFKTYSK